MTACGVNCFDGLDPFPLPVLPQTLVSGIPKQWYFQLSAEPSTVSCHKNSSIKLLILFDGNSVPPTLKKIWGLIRSLWLLRLKHAKKYIATSDLSWITPFLFQGLLCWWGNFQLFWTFPFSTEFWLTSNGTLPTWFLKLIPITKCFFEESPMHIFFSFAQGHDFIITTQA